MGGEKMMTWVDEFIMNTPKSEVEEALLKAEHFCDIWTCLVVENWDSDIDRREAFLQINQLVVRLADGAQEIKTRLNQ